MLGDYSLNLVPVGELDVDLPPTRIDVVVEGTSAGVPVDLGGVRERRCFHAHLCGDVNQRRAGEDLRDGGFDGLDWG